MTRPGDDEPTSASLLGLAAQARADAAGHRAEADRLPDSPWRELFLHLADVANADACAYDIAAARAYDREWRR